MIDGWLYERAARVLNRQIAASSSAARCAAELEGRSCRIRVEALPIDVVLRIEAHQVTFDHSDAQTDVTIAGTPFDLLYLTGADAERRIHDTGARLEGQIHVAEKFAELLRLAKPELEEELTPWIGDMAAHSLGTTVRGVSAWLTTVGTALREDTADYFKEESRVLVGSHEAEMLYTGIDHLRNDVARAEARLARLARVRSPK